MKAFPARFVEGVRHFNAGRFFEAHEAFEESLDDLEADARWDFALALVQVAVGYHKWASGHAGAARMLRLGVEKLAAFPADAWGIDVAALRRRIAEDAQAVEASVGPATAPRIVPARRVSGTPG